MSSRSILESVEKMRTLMGRRKALGHLAGGTLAVFLSSCGGGSSNADTSTAGESTVSDSGDSAVSDGGTYDASEATRETSNAQDGIFNDGYADQLLDLSGTPAAGYAGTIEVGVSTL